MNHWYNDNKAVWGLGEFLIGIDELNTAEQLLYYLYHPWEYTEVWVVYQREIMGIEVT